MVVEPGEANRGLYFYLFLTGLMEMSPFMFVKTVADTCISKLSSQMGLEVEEMLPHFICLLATVDTTADKVSFLPMVLHAS